MPYRTDIRVKATLTALTVVAGAAIAIAGDPGRGRTAFEKRCSGCHALDTIKAGPPLRGVYGRKSGKNPRFTYSVALKNTSVTWDEATLDRWLTDTDSVVPGNDMAFRLNDPGQRANIIAYLRQLSGK